MKNRMHEEDEFGVTNYERSQWALAALLSFSEETGQDKAGSWELHNEALQDLISDLLHLVNFYNKHGLTIDDPEPYTPAEIMRRAWGHYYAEAHNEDMPRGCQECGRFIMDEG